MSDVQDARGKALDAYDALKTMEFEEFREATSEMFKQTLGIYEAIIAGFGETNRKFQEDIIMAVKQGNEKQFDAAFEAFSQLNDRVSNMGFSMYVHAVVFKEKILKEILDDEAKIGLAECFGIDLKEFSHRLWDEAGQENTKGLAGVPQHIVGRANLGRFLVSQPKDAAA